jgi:hypothetical protein
MESLASRPGRRLDVKIQFFGMRAGQPDVDKYRQWSSALVNGVRDWFEK